MVLPTEKFLSPLIQQCTLKCDVTIFYYLVSSLLSVKWSLTGGKKQKKIQTFSPRSGRYERWSLTRGSKYSNLTGKLLIFWKTGR